MCTYRTNLCSGWGRTCSHTLVRALTQLQPRSCPRTQLHHQLTTGHIKHPSRPLYTPQTYLKLMEDVMNCNRVQKINLFKSGLSSPVPTADCIPVVFIELFEHSSAKESRGTSDQNSPTGNVNIFLGKPQHDKFCFYCHILLVFLLKYAQSEATVLKKASPESFGVFHGTPTPGRTNTAARELFKHRFEGNENKTSVRNSFYFYNNPNH